jgi:hypothetical protein
MNKWLCEKCDAINPYAASECHNCGTVPKSQYTITTGTSVALENHKFDTSGYVKLPSGSEVPLTRSLDDLTKALSDGYAYGGSSDSQLTHGAALVVEDLATPKGLYRESERDTKHLDDYVLFGGWSDKGELLYYRKSEDHVKIYESSKLKLWKDFRKGSLQAQITARRESALEDSDANLAALLYRVKERITELETKVNLAIDTLEQFKAAENVSYIDDSLLLQTLTELKGKIK